MPALRDNISGRAERNDGSRWQPPNGKPRLATAMNMRPLPGEQSPTAASETRARGRRPNTVSFAKGQEIFRPGQGFGQIYIVRSGFVRIFKALPDNRSINLGLLGPNTVFAQEDGFDGFSTGATAQAVVDSTLSIVNADELAGLIADSPDLAAAVVQGMNRRMTELQTLIEQLLMRDTAVRLATALFTLAKGFGRASGDGMISIALPLTHQALASMIGSNRVTVTRKLIELQRDGLVRSLGRNALSVHPERLRAYVQQASERA